MGGRCVWLGVLVLFSLDVWAAVMLRKATKQRKEMEAAARSLKSWIQVYKKMMEDEEKKERGF